MKPKHSDVTSQLRSVSSRKAWQRGAGLTVAALCCMPMTGGAQEGAMVLEEIIVTVQRREQSLQDVPVSVSALSQEQLDAKGIDTIDDLVAFTPGVSFGRTGFGSDLGSTISIRGISSFAGAATTGIYLDETPIQSRATIASGNFSLNAYPRLFDVERVEVLRGPQGTLFGAGAEGGAVRFITPSPSYDATTMYSRAEISSTDNGELSYEAGAAIGAPLVEDKIGIRASASYRQDGGFVDRYDFETGRMVDKDSNSGETLTARVALGFKVTDSLTVTPSVLYQKIELDDSSTYWVPGTLDGFTQPYGDVSDADYASGRRLPETAEQELTLSALKIEYDFGTVQLVANTSYYDREDNQITDYSNFEPALWTGGQFPFPPGPGLTAPATDHIKNEFFTQEVRLQSNQPDARLNWVVGLFYSDEDVFSSRWVANPWLGTVLANAFGCPAQFCVPIILGSPLVDGIYPFKGDTSTNDKQKAIFGQLDFKFTDKLTGTLGLRYADFDFEFANSVDGPINNSLDANGDPLPLPRVDRGKNSEAVTTPKVGLQYKLDSGALLYASAAKGFRVGGANAPVAHPSCVDSLAARGYDNGSPLTYDSDSVWAYEVGAKSDISDRVRLNGSVFYIEWDDIIQNVSLQPGCIFSFTDNVGGATSKGFDVEATIAPVDSLLLTAAIGYTDAYYTENFVAQTGGGPVNIVSSGDALIGSKWSGSLTAQLSFMLSSWEAYARASYSYNGKNDAQSFQNQRNVSYDADNLFIDPATHMYDLRAGVLVGDWDVNVFIDNVTNEHPVVNEGRVGGVADLRTAYPIRPRTIGLQATMRF